MSRGPHRSNPRPPRPGFSLVAGSPPLDFINTVRHRGRLEEFDTLDSYATVLDWSQQAELFRPAVITRLRRVARGDRTGAELALERAWRLRDLLYATFRGRARRGRVAPKHLAALNRHLREAGEHRVLRKIQGGGGDLTWDWDDPTDLDAPLWVVTYAAGDLLTGEAVRFVKECEGDACLRLFVDSSRNRRRRWCDTATCGNRHRVREHYWRTKGA